MIKMMAGNPMFAKMMPEMEKMMKDPEQMKQVEGLWKFMDDLSESNPDEYKTFIKT